VYETKPACCPAIGFTFTRFETADGIAGSAIGKHARRAPCLAIGPTLTLCEISRTAPVVGEAGSGVFAGLVGGGADLGRQKGCAQNLDDAVVTTLSRPLSAIVAMVLAIYSLYQLRPTTPEAWVWPAVPASVTLYGFVTAPAPGGTG